MTVREYRKRPVVIQAVQYDGRNYREVAEFAGHAAVLRADGLLQIGTLEGSMTVSVDDFVIRGVEGEFYPCKPGIFAATYEETNVTETVTAPDQPITEPDPITFQAWPKTPRLFRDAVITEKIDGTNAAIQIREVAPTPYDGKQVPGSFMMNDTTATGARRTYLVQAQSRKRLIYPNADGEVRDNYGFAEWVRENRAGLIRALGEGIHFGEWWGHGIQRGYGLAEGDRRFSLFNTHRHAKVLQAMADGYIPMVPGLGVVPVLDTYTFSTERVEAVKARLVESGSVAAPGFMDPEGVIVYHSAINGVFKSLIENDDKPKGE